MEMTPEVRAFWQQFLQDTGKADDTPCLEVFAFDDNEADAEELLALVLAGKKRATASAEAAFACLGMDCPKPGDLSIVTHWDGRPACVMETQTVQSMALRDMNFDLARLEGEDSCLESWMEKHIRFFQKESRRLGYVFSTEMTIVFETFKVVYPL